VRRLDRYVGRTVSATIGLALVVIVGLDAVAAFIDQAGDVAGAYTLGQAALYVLLTLPGRCYDYIPYAALIGCLLGLGQLASSSELVVMRAAGVSVGRLVWMSLKPALALACLGLLLGDLVAPQTDQMAETRRALAQDPGESLAGYHGIWNREGDTYLHFNALEPEGVVHGITLLQFDDRRRLRSALRSPRATFHSDHWQLEDVVQTRFSSWQTTVENHVRLRWETGITPQLLSVVLVEPGQLSLGDLYRHSRYLQQQGLESEDYQLALWRKLLQPAAIGGLVLVAISFIFGPLREGNMGLRIFAGVVTGIAFRTAQDLLGPASLVFGFHPLYAALAPILVCLGAGAFTLARVR